MNKLFNDIVNNLTCTGFNRICLNDSIDIYFNGIEYYYDAIILLIDDDSMARLELKKFNYKLCVDTVYIYF